MFIYTLTEFDSRPTRDIDFLIKNLHGSLENIELTMGDVRKEALTVEERPASVHTIKSDVSKSLIIFCSRGDMEGCSFWLPSKTENARH